MAMHRMRPPKNRQNLADSCWAAAFDSFSRVTAGVPRLRERDLIPTYGVGPTGGLNATNLATLSTMLAGHGVRQDLLPILTMPYDIEDRLRSSHVVLGRHLGGSSWHAWLIYSVDNYLSYMDPRDGDYHSIHWATWGFTSPHGWYLWHKP